MVLEEAEEEEAGGVVGASAAVEDGAGSALAALLDLRRPVFALIAEQLFLIYEACPVFRQDALSVVRL